MALVNAWRYTTIPANSQIVYPIDTTVTSDRGSVASASAPGAARAKYAGCRVRLLIKVGDNSLTWTAQIKTDNAAASTDFETDTTLVHTTGSGTGTLAASTTYKFSWYPAEAHFRFALTAGADNPDDLDVYVEIHDDPSSEAS